jgi:hypothetical protein
MKGQNERKRKGDGTKQCLPYKIIKMTKDFSSDPG